MRPFKALLENRKKDLLLKIGSSKWGLLLIVSRGYMVKQFKKETSGIHLSRMSVDLSFWSAAGCRLPFTWSQYLNNQVLLSDEHQCYNPARHSMGTITNT